MIDFARKYLCVYCWPRGIFAELWDEENLPCCKACSQNPNRKATAPHFVLDGVRRDPPTDIAA